jgi:hypothetical protein
MSSRRVQGGCPSCTRATGLDGSLSKQWATTGSITGPIGPQKFETCPRWGAKFQRRQMRLPRWLTAFLPKDYVL